MRLYMLHLFLFTNLHNNLQGVQDNQVGLSCKISIDECFMFQLCSGPTMKVTEGLIKLAFFKTIIFNISFLQQRGWKLGVIKGKQLQNYQRLFDIETYKYITYFTH